MFVARKVEFFQFKKKKKETGSINLPLLAGSKHLLVPIFHRYRSVTLLYDLYDYPLDTMYWNRYDHSWPLHHDSRHVSFHWDDHSPTVNLMSCQSEVVAAPQIYDHRTISCGQSRRSDHLRGV